MQEREFPSNARARKTAAPSPREEKEAVTPVVQGPVVRRKKPLGRRFTETFVGGDARGVGSFVFLDILMPAAKDMIVDAFTMGVERMVFGDSAPRRARGVHSSSLRHPGQQRTNFQQITAGGRVAPNEPLSRRARANFQFEEVILGSRVEADEVIASLIERIEKYDVATVRDLYNMINEEPRWTDEKYGWDDLTYATVRRARGGGYLLDLPKPEPLD